MSEKLIGSNDQAIRALARLRDRLEGHQRRISRKRVLRPSEKAMALTMYQEEIDALTLAISELEETANVAPAPA